MFKKGDKVKIRGGYFKGETGEVIAVFDVPESLEGEATCLVKVDTFNAYFYDSNLELFSTELMPSQDELNYLESDVEMTYTAYNQLKEYELLKPNHYQTKNGDLFDEWYARYPFETFRIVLLSTAERYFRRYHLKDGLDGLSKGIEVMKRLREYELKEQNND